MIHIEETWPDLSVPHGDKKQKMGVIEMSLDVIKHVID